MEIVFFYVAESGHTGPNLFDPSQPILYYGVLSNKMNLDIHAEAILSKLRKRLGVKRLHAAELGLNRLDNIIADIIKHQKKLDLRFDFYRVFKLDHAVISFFDQGLNPAVMWTSYWTPLRYPSLLKVAYFF